MTNPETHPPNETSLRRSNGLERASARRAELRAAGVKVERLDPLERAARSPKSLRLAINAKCYDCEARDSDPNVQLRIGTCTIQTCPLWPVRPYQDIGARETRGRRQLLGLQGAGLP